MNERIKKLLSRQLYQQYCLAYGYLALGQYFNDQNLSGYGKWFKNKANCQLDSIVSIYQFFHNQKMVTDLSCAINLEKSTGDLKDRLLLIKRLQLENCQSLSIIYQLACHLKDQPSIDFLKQILAKENNQSIQLARLLEDYQMFGQDFYLLDRTYGANAYA